MQVKGLSPEEEQKQASETPGDSKALPVRLHRLRLPMEGRVVQVTSMNSNFWFSFGWFGYHL